MNRLRAHTFNRCQEVGKYLINTGATTQQAAKHFNVSKSTIIRDVNLRLPLVNIALYWKARLIFRTHRRRRPVDNCYIGKRREDFM